MTPRDILHYVRRTPFEPFRLVLADGSNYVIHHPDQCMVMKKSVVIGEVAQKVGFIEWTININCWNVIRIEKAEPTVEDSIAVGPPEWDAFEKAEPTVEDSIAVGSPEWDALTDRRAELIHKKNREGLNEDEQTEFERLQKISRAVLTHAFPQPKLLSEAKTSDTDELLGSTEDRTDQ
jgi:hypothetical protein